MKKIGLILLGFAVVVILLELACQLHALSMKASWEALKHKPNHFFMASDSETLGYELRPGINYTSEDGRICLTTVHGIRGVYPAAVSEGVAILGDSVVFGARYSENDTIPRLVSARLAASGDERVVYNFGVPGYSLGELPSFLEEQVAHYPVSEIIYLMNLNDFAWRGTIYEGADNGLFRMYHPPVLKLKWYLGKLLYRSKKGGEPVSPEWYRWLFEGTNTRAFRAVKEMASYADERDIRFRVVILPAGCGYSDDRYLLEDIHARISNQVESLGCEVFDSAGAFLARHDECFDETDHLTVLGNSIVARVLADML